jgi:hypothetical protein
MATLALTFNDLREQVAHFLGWGTDSNDWTADQTTSLAAIIKSGYSQFCFPSLPPDGSSYPWSFLRPSATLATIAPYSTGTITGVAGVITLAGGTFPTNTVTALAELVVAGVAYAIASRDSGTQITLVDTSVTIAGGTSYSIVYSLYDLPAAFGGLEGTMTYRPGANTSGGHVEQVSAGELDRRRQASYATGKPTRLSVEAKTFDPTAGQAWRARLLPAPDAVYQLFYRYNVIPVALDGTNLYPVGGPIHAETLLESCLAVAEQRMDDNASLHTQKFMERLGVSIELDRLMGARDYLGSYTDRYGRANDPFFRRVERGGGKGSSLPAFRDKGGTQAK